MRMARGAISNAACGLGLALLAASGPIAEGRQAGPPGAAARTNTPSPNALLLGELLIEPPTLINLGFEWFIQGDENRNARVTVSFRKPGDSAWQETLPLLRIGGERIYAESRIDGIAHNMFA